jgi:2-oxoglutarate dehydrogenase E2 component (dihydrolipoamide succinyltransferase)
VSTLYVKIPALGESINEALIGKWKRSEGETVKADEPLVEVESDKATVELPAPAGGVLRRILHQTGETVPVGEVIAEIEEVAEAQAQPSAGQPAGQNPAAASTRNGSPDTATATVTAPPPPPPAPAPRSPATPAPQALARVDVRDGDGLSVKASPAVRRLMAEQEVSADEVHATGPAGRIERPDVERAIEAKRSEPLAIREAPTPSPPAHSVVPTAPATGAGQAGARERVVAMTPLRKTVARRLLEAQNTAAILTTFNEINMAEVMALRERYQETFLKRHGIKLGFMSFFTRAAVEALKAFPVVNAEVRGTDIVYKDRYDIGVAVGGGKGLVVPVVRDADRLSMAEIEKTIAELASKARENRLQISDLEEGTFTISNGGIYGSLLSTPILNPPQSGILGLHTIQKRPVAVGETIALRPMMYVALSYDHRIVDGKEAVQFLIRIKECLEDPQRILLEI